MGCGLVDLCDDALGHHFHGGAGSGICEGLEWLYWAVAYFDHRAFSGDVFDMFDFADLQRVDVSDLLDTLFQIRSIDDEVVIESSVDVPILEHIVTSFIECQHVQYLIKLFLTSLLDRIRDLDVP